MAPSHGRQDLERLTQWTLDALDLVVAFGHLQSSRQPEGGEAALLEAASSHLRRLLPFHTVAFLRVNEDDGDFVLSCCDPETLRTTMQREVDRCVADGVFALARRHNRAVAVRADRPGHAVVLHALVAGARTVGMFAGVLRGEDLDLGEAARNLLSLVLFQTAQALQGARLEATIRAQNRELEQTVEARTRELSRAEEALRHAQKMETIGQLTGGIAHDFNNLLTVILGNLERVQARTRIVQPELERMATRAIEAGRRGAELTRRLLAFGRRQPLSPRTIDVDRLVVGLTALLRRTLGETIDLKVVASGALAHADPGQVESALLNLTLNARDAMPRGGSLTITTSRRHLDEDPAAPPGELIPGEFVTIAVTDTGEGMTRETRERAFEPFFTTKPVGKGSGLGLSMVYGFAKQSGGHVTIESEVGCGTTVTLYLPAASGETMASPESGGAVTDDVLPGGRETILAVEDDADVREHVVSLLRDLGYHVLEAGTARDALALLETGTPPELLYTDVVLPGGMSGRELADYARVRVPSLRVLYTSGYTASAALADAAILVKPYRKEDLAHAIRASLEGETRN